MEPQFWRVPANLMFRYSFVPLDEMHAIFSVL